MYKAGREPTPYWW